ncbi:heme A synthase [bacterium LRH843]|nr:heme A synthase [bacterium LRH843]
MQKRLKIFGILTSIGVLIVLLQGALVTKTGSAEGCGATWPLCFGEVIPTNPAIETIIEYSHRIVSGLVGAMVIVLAIWSWKQLQHVKEARIMSMLAVLLIIFQGLLGAGAVIFGQSKAILALHFGISAMSLASVVLLTILSFEGTKTNPVTVQVTNGFKWYFLFVITYCYAVIYSGAYVKHMEATLACSGFPTCNGQLFPTLTGTVGIHYFHRIVGMILLLLLLILMIWTIRRFKHEPVLLWTSIIAFILVTAQLISGVSVVFSQNQVLSVSLMHALIISMLFSTLSYMGLVLFRKPIK